MVRIKRAGVLKKQAQCMSIRTYTVYWKKNDYGDTVSGLARLRYTMFHPSLNRGH